MSRRSRERIRRDHERRETARELAEIAVDKNVPQDVRRHAVTILSWLADKN